MICRLQSIYYIYSKNIKNFIQSGNKIISIWYIEWHLFIIVDPYHYPCYWYYYFLIAVRNILKWYKRIVFPIFFHYYCFCIIFITNIMTFFPFWYFPYFSFPSCLSLLPLFLDSACVCVYVCVLSFLSFTFHWLCHCHCYCCILHLLLPFSVIVVVPLYWYKWISVWFAAKFHACCDRNSGNFCHSSRRATNANNAKLLAKKSSPDEMETMSQCLPQGGGGYKCG